MTVVIYPPQEGDSVPTYASFANFPTSASDGSLAVSIDTDMLYAFNAAGNNWVLIGPNGGGGGGSNYVVNEFVLSGSDIANKYVTLSASPSNPSLTVLEVIGGPTQRYGLDYTISGNQLSWSGLFLEGVLDSSDLLIVQIY